MRKLLTVPLCFLLLAAGIAHAHDPGLSAAECRIQRGQLIARLVFAPVEAARLEGRHLLEVLANGKTLPPATVQQSVGSTDVGFELTYLLPADPMLTLRITAFDQLPRGHRQYLTIRDEGNDLLFEGLLDANAREVKIPSGASDHRPTFRMFVALGVVHILTGYDHLLFLCGLLLVGGSFRSIARIITSFTVAHSITLGAATLGLVHFSSRLVEPLIAVTIIYVGVENVVRRGEIHWRWLLAFAFGLIHGFGFASALRELGIGAGGSGAVQLLSFNLGVELGQVAIATLVLPVIWRLGERPLFVTRYVPACSVAVALVGSYWLIERTLL